MAARRLTVPGEVRDAVRRALAAKPTEVPEVAYRLASGWALPDDRQDLALWCLDNSEQFEGNRCTVTAALRGGNSGMRWAITAALNSDTDTVHTQLDATVRSDQQLIQQIAAAIHVAWDRQLDHAARKARSRLTRSTQGREIDFIGWPNAEAAQFAGVDDLMDRAWDAFVASLTLLFADYARTQASYVAVVDDLGAESVRRMIAARVPAIINALTGFLDSRARSYLVGDVVFAPQDFAAARAVAAWLSGASSSPEGFTFSELAVGRFATGLSSAQEALLAAVAEQPERLFTWVHSFYGAPLVPFPPHEQLDGAVITAAEASVMTLHPGDHINCRCELVPLWGF